MVHWFSTHQLSCPLNSCCCMLFLAPLFFVGLCDQPIFSNLKTAICHEYFIPWRQLIAESSRFYFLNFQSVCLVFSLPRAPSQFKPLSTWGFPKQPTDSQENPPRYEYATSLPSCPARVKLTPTVRITCNPSCSTPTSHLCPLSPSLHMATALTSL